MRVDEKAFLCGRLFQEPSEAFLRQIVEERLLTQMEEGWDSVEDPRWPAQAGRIALDHAALFTFYDCGALPLCESCWFRGPLVEEFYREAGYKTPPCYTPDHLSCELEFLGFLWARGQEASAVRFFQEHLGRWIFHFLQRLKAQSVSPFYRAVAGSMERFLLTNPGGIRGVIGSDESRAYLWCSALGKPVDVILRKSQPGEPKVPGVPWGWRVACCLSQGMCGITQCPLQAECPILEKMWGDKR